MLLCTNPVLWGEIVLSRPSELLQRHLLLTFFGMLRRHNLLPARLLLLRHEVPTDATVAQQWLYSRNSSVIDGSR